MNEEVASQELQKLLDWMYANHVNFSEANLNTGTGKTGFVQFHLDKIYRECEGKWADEKASIYVQSLANDLQG